MAEYRLKGEDFLGAFSLEHVSSKEFSGVIVYRLWGTRPNIEAATAGLEKFYPAAQKTTLGDAVWLGTVRAPGQVAGEKAVYEDLYELIVMLGV